MWWSCLPISHSWKYRLLVSAHPSLGTLSPFFNWNDHVATFKFSTVDICYTLAAVEYNFCNMNYFICWTLIWFLCLLYFFIIYSLSLIRLVYVYCTMFVICLYQSCVEGLPCMYCYMFRFSYIYTISCVVSYFSNMYDVLQFAQIPSTSYKHNIREHDESKQLRCFQLLMMSCLVVQYVMLISNHILVWQWQIWNYTLSMSTALDKMLNVGQYLDI